jgi:DNA-binding NtrC family response regulator
VDVRFVAATNRDLLALVETGAFRRDLYFRLNGLTIEIPPLRRRVDEIPILAVGFLREACRAAGVSPPTLSALALAALCAYPFPGNVRELRNLMGRAVLLCRGGEILPEHLRLGVLAGPTLEPPAKVPPQLHEEIDMLERKRILAALDESGGNQTRAAAALGIARRTLIHRMEEYGLPRPRRRV